MSAEVRNHNTGSASYIFRNVSFRQLQVFEAVARLSNFTAASRELHITQPTVSMQVKKLEESLNTRLFEQVGRRIHLTYEGHAFLNTCQQVFSSLNQFESHISERIDTVQGQLAIAGVTTTEYFAPLLLGAFKAAFPDVQVILSIQDRENVLNRLRNNLDDLYLIDQVPPSIGVEAIPFIENPLVVVAPSDHPFSRRRNVTMEALNHEVFLLREPTSGTRIALNKFLDLHHIDLNIGMELSSNEALKRAVYCKMGLSVLSTFCIADECARGELTALHVKGFPLVERWFIVYPKDRHLQPAAGAFLNFLQEEGKSIIQNLGDS